MCHGNIIRFGERLGKSRVCEVGREVLCQIYAKDVVELWRGLRLRNSRGKNHLLKRTGGIYMIEINQRDIL